MTAKERFLAAVNHQEGDRVPLCLDAEKEVFTALQEALHCSSKREVYDLLHIDEWMLDPEVTDPRVRIVNDGEMVTQWGYTIKEEVTDYGSYGLICNEPLKAADPNQETIDTFNWPDPDELHFEHWPGVMQDMGERAYIGHFTHGPYFNCTYLRGMEEYLMDMVINPLFAEALMLRAEEYLQAGLDRLLATAGAELDVFYIADDFCGQSGPLFNPKDWRRLVKPYLTRMADKVHKAGKKFMLHVCGSVRCYIPDLIEAGVDILEPIQSVAAGMDISVLKQDFGNDITFYGSMDTTLLLPKGSVGDVEDAVKRTLDIMAPGGGFVLGPAHTYIQPDTPVENIIAMYRTARSYGKY